MKLKIPMGKGRTVTVNVPILKSAKAFVNKAMGSIDSEGSSAAKAQGQIKDHYETLDSQMKALESGNENPGEVFPESYND